jgi:hypothetical protein
MEEWELDKWRKCLNLHVQLPVYFCIPKIIHILLECVVDEWKGAGEIISI